MISACITSLPVFSSVAIISPLPEQKKGLRLTVQVKFYPIHIRSVNVRLSEQSPSHKIASVEKGSEPSRIFQTSRRFFYPAGGLMPAGG
jgi:hypothetical protein